MLEIIYEVFDSDGSSGEKVYFSFTWNQWIDRFSKHHTTVTSFHNSLFSKHFSYSTFVLRKYIDLPERMQLGPL